MKVKEKIKEELEGLGMEEADADKVLEAAVPKLKEMGMNVGWESDAETYPKATIDLLWMVVRDVIAKEWIETNAPNAWYRPMFE